MFRTLQHPILAQKSVAEFFAGIGLVRLGLEPADWRVVFANDIAEDKERLYAGHFRDNPSHFLRQDIHTLNAASVPSTTLATASFPCTDLSLAGMRRGLSGKHSSAFWGFVRILDELGDRKPPIVMLENVAGFLTSHEGRDFQSALLALNQLGYAVDAFILDAARFVPQSRVRLFVVGRHMAERGRWKVYDNPSFLESALRPKALAQFIFDHPEISWGLRTLPIPPRSAAHKIDHLLEKLPDTHPAWWSEERTRYLASQMSDRHAQILGQMMHNKKWSSGTVFRRVRNGLSRAELRTDGVAGCLRTPKGGSAKQILIQAGYGRVRARLLTARECARLMGADEFFLDNVGLNEALFGFGDAVCVPVISWIAENYLNPLVEEMLSEPTREENEIYSCKTAG